MIRITAGELKGRAVKTPGDSTGVRPTQAKLRQALFNTLQDIWSGARVLDLFSGPGTLAFEAISRGASFAVLVEASAGVARTAERNAQDLGVSERVLVLRAHFPEAMKKVESLAETKRFDVVFADPPYDQGHEQALVSFPYWDSLLKPGSWLLIEKSARSLSLPDATGPLTKVREKAYGDTILTTYRMHLG